MSDHDHEHHESHSAAYFRVFIALCGCTAVSVLADTAGLPKAPLAVVVLAVAVAKALCVMMLFMHLKFERAWKYLLLAPTTIIALALPVSLRPDIGETYYTTDVQQMRDYDEHVHEMEKLKQHGAHGGGQH